MEVAPQLRRATQMKLPGTSLHPATVCVKCVDLEGGERSLSYIASTKRLELGYLYNSRPLLAIYTL